MTSRWTPMPPGKFVSGVTRTPLGDVTILGVCIPYHHARTKWTNDGVLRKPWEDHRQYLAGLPKVFERASSKRLIVLGDFNQQVGQNGYAPPKIREALQDALPPSITIATAALGFGGRRVIDHVALNDDLAARSLRMISRFHEHIRPSDHPGSWPSCQRRSNRPVFGRYAAVRPHASIGGSAAYAGKKATLQRGGYDPRPLEDKARGRIACLLMGLSAFMIVALLAGVVVGAIPVSEIGRGLRALVSSRSNSSSGVRPTFWTTCRSWLSRF